MSRRLPHTPTSRIKGALHGLWLRSRERSAAVKRESGCCQRCGAKGRAKATRNGPRVILHVHHMDGVKWEQIVAYIRAHLLVPPERLEVLCADCHGREHEHD